MENKERMDAMELRLTRLMEHQERTNEQLQKLIEQTSGIIEVYHNLQGTVKILVTAQKIMTWCAKWPLIITGVWTAFEFFKK